MSDQALVLGICQLTLQRRVALQTANSDSSLTSSEATPDKEIPQSFNLPLA